MGSYGLGTDHARLDQACGHAAVREHLPIVRPTDLRPGDLGVDEGGFPGVDCSLALVRLPIVRSRLAHGAGRSALRRICLANHDGVMAGFGVDAMGDPLARLLPKGPDDALAIRAVSKTAAISRGSSPPP